MPKGRTREKAISKLQLRMNLSDLMVRHPGRPQEWYAAQLDCSQATISRATKEIHRDWEARTAQNKEQMIQAEIDRLNRIEAEAWEAWAQSKKAKTVTTKEKVEQKGWHGSAKIKLTTQEPAGDPRFLDVILRCQQQRAAILGYEAPKKVNVTIEAGKAIAGRLMAAAVAALGTSDPALLARFRESLLGEQRAIASEQREAVVDAELMPPEAG